MSQLKIKNGATWEEIPAGGIGVPSGGTEGQVLTKSSATDYATQWATPQNIVLLWENSNKATDASFAAQTINVDTSEYDFLLIVFCVHTHWTSNLAVQIIKNGTVGYIFAQSWGGEIQPGQSLQTYTRKVDASSTSAVVFGTAYYGTSSSAGTLNVPFYIYGVKA